MPEGPRVVEERRVDSVSPETRPEQAGDNRYTQAKPKEYRRVS